MQPTANRAMPGLRGPGGNERRTPANGATRGATAPNNRPTNPTANRGARSERSEPRQRVAAAALSRLTAPSADREAPGSANRDIHRIVASTRPMTPPPPPYIAPTIIAPPMRASHIRTLSPNRVNTMPNNPLRNPSPVNNIFRGNQNQSTSNRPAWQRYLPSFSNQTSNKTGTILKIIGAIIGVLSVIAAPFTLGLSLIGLVPALGLFFGGVAANRHYQNRANQCA